MTLLLEINTLELMTLWGELVEAYHGVNGYGGSVAEIYAYRFINYNPVIHMACDKYKNSYFYQEQINENNRKTKGKLIELVALFCDKHNCEAIINKMSLKDFENSDIVFEHRVHVEIKPRSKK